MSSVARLVVVAAATVAFGQNVAASSAVFPSAYTGRWGETLAGCAAGAVHGGITISPTMVRDGEFHGRLLSVQRTAGALRASEAWDFAGAPARVTKVYELAEAGRRLSVAEDVRHPPTAAGVTRYVRCEASGG